MTALWFTSQSLFSANRLSAAASSEDGGWRVEEKVIFAVEARLCLVWHLVPV